MASVGPLFSDCCRHQFIIVLSLLPPLSLRWDLISSSQCSLQKWTSGLHIWQFPKFCGQLNYWRFSLYDLDFIISHHPRTCQTKVKTWSSYPLTNGFGMFLHRPLIRLALWEVAYEYAPLVLCLVSIFIKKTESSSDFLKGTVPQSFHISANMSTNRAIQIESQYIKHIIGPLPLSSIQ